MLRPSGRVRDACYQCKWSDMRYLGGGPKQSRNRTTPPAVSCPPESLNPSGEDAFQGMTGREARECTRGCYLRIACEVLEFACDKWLWALCGAGFVVAAILAIGF